MRKQWQIADRVVIRSGRQVLKYDLDRMLDRLPDEPLVSHIP